MRPIVLSLVIAAAACGTPRSVSDILPEEPPHEPSITLHMDVDFTPAERTSLGEAASLWRKQTSGLADIKLVYDLDFSDLLGLTRHALDEHNVVVRLTSGMDQVTAEDEGSGCEGCVLGWMNSGGMHGPGHEPIHGAFVVDRIPNGLATQVMLHEFGHTLGVPHVQSVQSIMYPALVRGRTTCLKKADLTAFCSVNECGDYRMFPCE